VTFIGSTHSPLHFYRRSRRAPVCCSWHFSLPLSLMGYSLHKCECFDREPTKAWEQQSPERKTRRLRSLSFHFSTRFDASAIFFFAHHGGKPRRHLRSVLVSLVHICTRVYATHRLQNSSTGHQGRHGHEVRRSPSIAPVLSTTPVTDI
jgi:hypothetical protein